VDISNSLEHNILAILKKAGTPLNAKEITETLFLQEIRVPESYILRVLSSMVEFNLITQQGKRAGQTAYQATDIRFWRNRISNLPQWLKYCLKKPVRHKNSQKRGLDMSGQRKSWAFSLFSVCLLALPQLAQANEPVALSAPASSPILTTRPSFTDAWLSVPKGSVQVETGATNTDLGHDQSNWVLPETLVKVGITEHADVRVTLPNLTALQQPGDDSALLGDTSVGLTLHRRLPAQVDLAIIPILNLPTGANSLSSNALDPQLRVVVSKPVNAKLVLASQLDTRWNTGANASTDWVFNPTLIGYYTFSPKWSSFLEYGGFFPTTGVTTHYLQGGVLYLITPRQQLDVRVATGLNQAASDFLIGFGYSFRLDGRK